MQKFLEITWRLEYFRILKLFTIIIVDRFMVKSKSVLLKSGDVAILLEGHEMLV